MGLHYTVNNSTSKKFLALGSSFWCGLRNFGYVFAIFCTRQLVSKNVLHYVTEEYVLVLQQYQYYFSQLRVLVRCTVLLVQSSIVQCTSFELLNLRAKELQLEVEGTTVLQNHRCTINAGEVHLRSGLVGTLGALFSRSSHVAGLLSRSSHAHTSSLFISDGYCGLRGRTFELFDTARLGFSLPFVEV